MNFDLSKFNTVSHLCAGLVEINRTGNDTSGGEWEATKKNSVNTLASPSALMQQHTPLRFVL